MSFWSFFITTIPLSPIEEPGAGWTDLGSVISALLRLAMLVGVLAAIFYFIMGGVNWITSGGDAKKTEAAGKQITNALVGLGILAAVWVFITIMEKFFNIKIINLEIPQPR